MRAMNRTARLALVVSALVLASCGGDRYLQLQTRRAPMMRDVSFGGEIRELPWKPPGLGMHRTFNPWSDGPAFKDDLPVDIEDQPNAVHYHVTYDEPTDD